jgi:hypothetical protein
VLDTWTSTFGWYIYKQFRTTDAPHAYPHLRKLERGEQDAVSQANILIWTAYVSKPESGSYPKRKPESGANQGNTFTGVGQSMGGRARKDDHVVYLIAHLHYSGLKLASTNAN